MTFRFVGREADRMNYEDCHFWHTRQRAAEIHVSPVEVQAA